MVLKDQRRAPLRGLALVHGSVRLMALRWLLLVLSGAAGALIATGPLATAARRPYFAAAEGPLDISHAARMLGEVGPALGAALAIAALLALAGHWLLVPSAVLWLDRVRRGDRPRRLSAFVIENGTPRLWAMARVTLLALLLAGAGLGLLRILFERLDVMGQRQAWDSATLVVLLPRLRWLTAALWLALVGAGAFWCRLVMAADGRVRVRSAALIVLRAWRRLPLAGPLLFIIVTVVLQALGAGYLFAWRQAAPRSLPALAAWPAGWLLLLFLHAAAWHWLLRSALLGYGSPRLAAVRARPDRPWFLLRRLTRRPLPPAPGVVAAVTAPEPEADAGPEPGGEAAPED